MIKKQSSKKITPKLRQESFDDNNKAVTPMSNRRKEAINETRPLLNTNAKSTFSSKLKNDPEVGDAFFNTLDLPSSTFSKPGSL